MESDKKTMTNEELKQLAKDFFAGKIATQHNCESPAELVQVFTPLMFMTQEHRENIYRLIVEGGIIYEYYDNAIVQRIRDRMPTFWFFHSLNAQDFKKILNFRFNSSGGAREIDE